jgi:hypothetical protein
MICNECETVAHCLKNGCVPKQLSKDEALKLALEFVEANHSGGPDAFELITAIKQALASPVQQSRSDVEPVAWVVEDEHGERLEWAGDAHSCHGLPTLPLYTAAQRQWVGLSKFEMTRICKELYDVPISLAFAIEAKLKEKNL